MTARPGSPGGTPVHGVRPTPTPDAGTATPAAALPWTTRLSRRLGIAGTARPSLVLAAGVVGLAVIVVVLGVRQSVQLPGGLAMPARVGIAAALAAAAQLARLRFRLGRLMVTLAGGEAAFILGFALVPAGWLPACTFVGALAACSLTAVLSDRRRPVQILESAAAVTLAVAAAAAVTAELAGPRPGPLTPQYGVALVAGCGTYLLVSIALSVLSLGLNARHETSGFRWGPTVARTVHGRLPMFAGNVLVGMFALLAADRQPGWLILALPALWLLHRAYRLHVRAQDERRLWSAFATAVRALGDAGERDVATVGVHGALDVFGAEQVRITVHPADGSAAVVQAAGPAVTRPDQPVVTRELSAAGTRIGELTLSLAPSTVWGTPDDLAVSAYAQALANALHDATVQQRLAALDARVSQQALHDPLTGLLNRAALLTHGDRLLGALNRSHPVALLLVDLNGFGQVNGTLGWNAGDKLLKVVGRRLDDLARGHELVARIGDDGFAVLLPHVAPLSDSAHPLDEVPPPLPQAVRRAQELVAALAAEATVDDVRLVTDAAVGVVVTKAGCCDVAELIRCAEIALGQAKHSQVGIAVYDDSREPGGTDRLAMLAELAQALAVQDQVVLALQPAVDLETGAPTGVEALSRWHHPRRGWLPPAEFIGVVEHSELIGPFTRYMLDRSLAAAAGWAAAGLDLPVSVNVAARSLLDTTFPGQVRDALRRHGVPARLLVLEITETVAVSEQPIVDDVVRALRDVGVQLSVDDFGTGYSSLAFLDRMPVDELKVDRSFVAGMADSPRSAAIVRFAVELGRRLDLRVVAEGVETADQRAALLDLGCTSAQGYHFCKPLPADKIVEALRALGEGAQAKVVPLRADGAS